MDDMSVIAYLNRGFMATKKPLDVLIAEMQDYLSSYRIDASDTVYFETNNPLYTVANDVTYNIPISIKINLTGIIRLKYTYSYLNVYTYKNGVQIDNRYSSSSSVAVSADYTVEKGDVLTFAIKGRNATTSSNKFHAATLNVCGYITPLMQTNLIELI